MKLLTALSLLQTVCIVYLLVVVSGDRAHEAAARAAPATQTGSNPFGSTASASSVGPGFAQDEARLRQIIREELAALHLAGASQGEVAAAPVDPVEASRRKSQVAQRINYFRSVGKVSEQQMAELQIEIARLDPAGRKEMLGMLARAINAQEIKAQM